MDVTEQARHDRLDKSLKVLKVINPSLTRRLEQTECTIDFVESVSGHLTGRATTSDGENILLASNKNPVTEAARWMDGMADYSEDTHTVVVVGCGLGYHIAELLSRHSGGLVVVLESSLELVKAMLMCQDFAYDLLCKRLVLLVDVARSDMSTLLHEFKLGLIFGSLLARHPASARVSPDGLRVMLSDFTDNLAFIRSGIVTAMQISAMSCDNGLKNLPSYLDYPGINDLKDAFKGIPAVCVAAGPSLRSSMDTLREVQGRFPIIAVQTVLKTLLEAGIKPDYVTSLDFSEHSRRFYEELGDIGDMTLIADPKVNPIVPESFPGPVRMFRNEFLEDVLSEMPEEMDHLKPGATVAHLNMYFAEYMGCGPIVLLGQDLGFGNNIYYTPGTPIHNMWAVEQNRFRTVEMFQWERVIRFKNTLRRTLGQDGRQIYADAQMFSYLQQFEQDIPQCRSKVINCSIGGARIAGTEEMTFEDFVAQHADVSAGNWPAVSARHSDADARRQTALECIEKRQAGLFNLRKLCDQVLPMLRRMSKLLDDAGRFNELHARMEKVRSRLEDMMLPYGLVSRYAQLAEIRRVQQDAALGRKNLDELAARREQLTRDIQYVDFIKKGCRQLSSSLDAAVARLKEKA